MTILKYKRKLNDLEIKELQAVLTKYKPELDLKTIAKKETFKLQVQAHFGSLSTKPLWYTTEPDNPFFYFSADDETRTITCVDVVTEISEESEFNNDRPFKWKFESDEKPPQASEPKPPLATDQKTEINQSANQLDNRSETSHHTRTYSDYFQDNDNPRDLIAIIQKQSDQMEILMSQLGNRNSQRVNDKFKITYSEETGIPAFLAQIEEWSKLYNYDDSDKIKKAIASLVMSKEGLAIRECLNAQSFSTWEQFKKTINGLLGKDRAHYRAQFRSITPKDYENFGSFLARLTLSYKYANALDDQALTEKDKDLIKQQFIESLNYPLRGHLESEDYLGNIQFENMATRATQLQRAHQPAKAEQVCALRQQPKSVSFQPPEQTNDLKNFISEQGRVLQNQSQLLEKMLQLVISNQNQKNNSNTRSDQHYSRNRSPGRNYSRDRSPGRDFSRNQSSHRNARGPMSDETRAKLASQPCYYFKNGNCRWGDRCHRSHLN